MNRDEVFALSIDQEATGKRIFELIREKGYSVNDVIEYTGISSTQAVYKWKQGNSIPGTDNLARISAMLGMSIENLIVVKSSGKDLLLGQVISQGAARQQMPDV